MATLLEMRQKETACQIAIMQAYLDGSRIAAKACELGIWHETKYPVWNWSDFDYKVYEDADEAPADR